MTERKREREKERKREREKERKREREKETHKSDSEGDRAKFQNALRKEKVVERENKK